jgi:hypothetical protein
MLESGSSGSVRGVLSNEHSYREQDASTKLFRIAIKTCRRFTVEWYAAAAELIQND